VKSELLFRTDLWRLCLLSRRFGGSEGAGSGADLILIDPMAEPPLAQEIDYGQWEYENKRKRHEAKRRLAFLSSTAMIKYNG
jgi:hypothetical protein